ncbi:MULTISPECIES: acyltransferase family protein [unclassified Coleofasciculus]|uniref:acyltransferase family protein n=1 Tax=unclassified Coleofasciculus TaxID=2692782 RepID=UPI001881CAA2|nr:MULTISPECIES: acyltransferase [unclassified Coleofasciculus]MBE9128804.1 acyltransferase [Coleofasciculus sp. LEGE 07081]MBE9149439.1 acyltransferase [Coleofasciculus sp. LEGE 07092]
MSSKKTTSKKHLPWIDQLKGLAILGIISFHFFQNYPDRIELVQNLYRNGARWGYAAVDIFLVIAGFNTSYSLASRMQSRQLSPLVQVDWKSWLLKRLSRLYPTYWLAIGVTLLLYYLFREIEIKSFQDFIGIVIGLPSYERFKTINPGFWFFSVILQAYLVIPLIFSFCQSKPQLILILGILGGLITKIACLLFYRDFDVFWFLLQNNFLGSYFFQLGLGLYWGFIYFEQQKFRKIDLAISSLSFILGAFLYFYLIVKDIDFAYKIGFDMAFTPLFFIGIHWLFKRINLEKISPRDIFSRMGFYSYQIYLIHQPLLFLILPYLGREMSLAPYPRLLVSILATTVLLTLYVLAFIQLEILVKKLTQKIPKHSV